RFDAEAAVPSSNGHVVCPNCSAKLRFRARPAMAAPQETPAGDGIALPGISDQATATSGTGTSAGASPSSPPEPSAPGEIALPGLGTASGSSVTDNSSITTGLGRNREPEIPLPT